MSSSGSDKYVSVLSKRLLEGWALLADNCPNCTIPLVRSKQGAIYCVKCEMYCLRENEVPQGFSVSQLPAASLSPKPPAAPEIQTTAKAVEKPKVTPSEYQDDDMDDWKPPSEEEMTQIEARRRKNDTHSAAIAKKLLEGWILLNDCCPNKGCTVPLIKNRNNQLFCVSCNNWIPVESNAITGIPEIKTKSAESLHPQTQPHQTLKAKPQPQPQPHQNPADMLTGRSAFIHTGTPGTSQFSAKGHREVVSAAIAAIYAKLDVLRIHLSSSQDIDETKMLLNGINDCLSGIQKLKEIHLVL